MKASEGAVLRGELRDSSDRVAPSDPPPEARARFPSYATGAGPSTSHGQFPSFTTGQSSTGQLPSYPTGGGKEQFPTFATGSAFPSFVTGGGSRAPVLPGELPSHFERFLLKNSKADLQPLQALERDLQDLGLPESKAAVLLSRLSLHGVLLPRFASHSVAALPVIVWHCAFCRLSDAGDLGMILRLRALQGRQTRLCSSPCWTVPTGSLHQRYRNAAILRIKLPLLCVYLRLRLTRATRKRT